MPQVEVQQGPCTCFLGHLGLEDPGGAAGVIGTSSVIPVCFSFWSRSAGWFYTKTL